MSLSPTSDCKSAVSFDLQNNITAGISDSQSTILIRRNLKSNPPNEELDLHLDMSDDDNTSIKIAKNTTKTLNLENDMHIIQQCILKMSNDQLTLLYKQMQRCNQVNNDLIARKEELELAKLRLQQNQRQFDSHAAVNFDNIFCLVQSVLSKSSEPQFYNQSKRLLVQRFIAFYKHKVNTLATQVRALCLQYLVERDTFIQLLRNQCLCVS